MRMLSVLDVSALNRFLYPAREHKLTSTDIQTAIFKETTTNLTPWDDLKRRHPFNGPGYPEDVARMAVVLASDDASWMTGVCLPVDGGYTAR